MTRLTLIASATLAAAVVISSAAFAWRSPTAGHGWSGWAGHRPGHGLERLCDGTVDDRLPLFEGHGRRALALRSDQEPAFRALMQAVRTSLPGLRESACPSDDETANPADLLVALDRSLSAASAAVVAVRPAWDAFLATLDDRQREILKEGWRRWRT